MRTHADWPRRLNPHRTKINKKLHEFIHAMHDALTFVVIHIPPPTPLSFHLDINFDSIISKLDIISTSLGYHFGYHDIQIGYHFGYHDIQNDIQVM